MKHCPSHHNEGVSFVTLDGYKHQNVEWNTEINNITVSVVSNNLSHKAFLDQSLRHFLVIQIQQTLTTSHFAKEPNLFVRLVL